jgi:hypothetical protein
MRKQTLTLGTKEKKKESLLKALFVEVSIIRESGRER